jgi:hypothetical protein
MLAQSEQGLLAVHHHELDENLRGLARFGRGLDFGHEEALAVCESGRERICASN